MPCLRRGTTSNTADDSTRIGDVKFYQHNSEQFFLTTDGHRWARIFTAETQRRRGNTAFARRFRTAIREGNEGFGHGLTLINTDF